MAPPLPDEIVRKILEDLNSERYKSGNLSLAEIAAIRLGDNKKGGTISKLAKKHKIQLRKQGVTKKKPFQSGHSSKETQSEDPINVECFTPEARLLLIDTALSQLKAILPKTNYSKGMNEWTSSAERLMNLRREEEPDDHNDTEDDGYLEAVRSTASEDWADAKKEACSIPVEATEQETEDGPELVDA